MTGQEEGGPGDALPPERLQAGRILRAAAERDARLQRWLWFWSPARPSIFARHGPEPSCLWVGVLGLGMLLTWLAAPFGPAWARLFFAATCAGLMTGFGATLAAFLFHRRAARARIRRILAPLAPEAQLALLDPAALGSGSDLLQPFLEEAREKSREPVPSPPPPGRGDEGIPG